MFHLLDVIVCIDV